MQDAFRSTWAGDGKAVHTAYDLRSGAGNVAWRFDHSARRVSSHDGLTGAYSYSGHDGFGVREAGVSDAAPVE